MDQIPWGVLWEEGLFLQPHHMQQMLLGLRADAAHRLSFVLPHRWGVAAVEVDPLQLEQGRFEVRRLEMLLPSGEAVVFRGDRPGNARVQTRDIPQVAVNKLRVHAGVRRLRENEPNVLEPGEQEFDPARYQRASRTVTDLASGRNLVDVQFQELNVRVFFDGDRMDGFETVPIAELVAPAAGLPLTRLSPLFAPPALLVSATGPAYQAVKEVYAEAARKSAELAGAATVSDIVSGRATEAELVQILKLLALRHMLPRLREAADAGVAHPYVVYHDLCSFLGQFATLSEGATLPTLPLYDHQNLGTCFEQVTTALLGLLRADQLAANFRKIELRKGSLGIAGVAVGAQNLDAEWLRGRSEFYLAFTNPDPGGRERDWYRSGHMKVAAPTRISDVVNQRKYGVGLVPCPKPRALPSRTGAVYFKLETAGASRPEGQAEWEAVTRERALVVYFATEGLLPGQPAPDLGMEAYVVFGR